MSWVAIRDFNQSKAGNQAGWCLRNVRTGYGISSKYNTANEAWNHTQQHTGTPPDNCTVPLFFDYKTDGHINVRLANGQVWSDGTMYASLDDYLAKHTSVHYKGWGESVNDVPVVEHHDDPQPSQGQRLYFEPIGQTATFYKLSGGTYSMYIADSSYNWAVLDNQGYKVKINSKSAGGECWVYLTYQSGDKKGQQIPGRSVR